MEILSAINKIKRAVGGTRVNAVSDAEATNAKECLERELRSILASGFHFNADVIDLQVDANGRVPLSQDYLGVRFPLGTAMLSWRDDPANLHNRFVWNRDTNDWHDQDISDVEVVTLMTFERLPERFADWVCAKASLENWHDSNNGKVNVRLIEAEKLACAMAINSLTDGRLNLRTTYGYSRVAQASRRAVNAGGAWVWI